MLTIRTSKFNTTIKKPSPALFLWLHNPKGWMVGKPEVVLGPDLFDGQVVNAHRYCVGLSETNPRPTEEPAEIDPAGKEVMEEQKRSISGGGPSVAKEVQRRRAIVKTVLNAIKDERAFSAEARRGEVKDGSPEWKKAWEIYRSACGRQ